MIKARTISIIFIVLGVLIILTPRAFFPVCGFGEKMFQIGRLPGHHGCHNTLTAVSILGVIAIFTGAFPLFQAKRKAVLFASIIFIVLAAFVILFPTTITGICKMPTMACRLGTLPALVTGGIIMGIAGIAGILISRKIQ